MHLPLLLACKLFHWKRGLPKPLRQPYSRRKTISFHASISYNLLHLRFPCFLRISRFVFPLHPFTGCNIQYSYWTISPGLMYERRGRARLNEGAKGGKIYDDTNLESSKSSSPERRVSNLTLSVGASSFSYILKTYELWEMRLMSL